MLYRGVALSTPSGTRLVTIFHPSKCSIPHPVCEAWAPAVRLPHSPAPRAHCHHVGGVAIAAPGDTYHIAGPPLGCVRSV